jgi:hypothetical protein
MKAEREKLISVLRFAAVGRSMTEVLEQSVCFVFTGGELITFNDEVLTRQKSPLDFDAVVRADDFTKLLNKFPDDEVEISLRSGKEILVKGRKRSAGIFCETEVRLPVDSIPKTPKTFKAMPSETMAALRQAADTCRRDDTHTLSSSVHVTKDYIEACDNERFYRRTGATGFSDEILIPAFSIDSVGSLPLNQVAADRGWLFFRAENRAVVAVRCSHEKYHEGIERVLEMKDGEKAVLPSNLADMVARAEVMQSGAGWEARLGVRLENGELTLSSRNERGWYRESKRTKYRGPDLAFEVNPRFLLEILGHTRNIQLNAQKMKLEAAGVQFVVALQISEED